jgi:polyhydroxyalkanoate synthesis regulator phasin
MKINGVLMEELSIKSYAVKHKLSIFNVMKMVKSGKLKSMLKEENGKEVTYILVDDKIEEEVRKGIVPIDEQEHMSIKEEMEALRKEVSALRSEVASLKKAII